MFVEEVGKLVQRGGCGFADAAEGEVGSEAAVFAGEAEGFEEALDGLEEEFERLDVFGDAEPESTRVRDGGERADVAGDDFEWGEGGDGFLDGAADGVGLFGADVAEEFERVV